MKCFKVSDRFVHYYQAKGFEVLPSASLLDPSIPMSFVMSAGLVQIETSLQKIGRINGDSYVLRQNCFRHFDLEQVGRSNVHLCLFEMPGAFVFNPNDKSSTVERMWDLVTGALCLDAARLWVTYFAGGVKGGHSFPPDTETCESWKQIGLSEERIVALGPKDNFWMQGGGIDGDEPTRKCGPNTEIFFDRGEKWSCGARCRPGCPCGRFVEFANSLFISAEVDRDTNVLHPLDIPFNETVIGTERVAMISQNQASVFGIDSLQPLVDKVCSFSARSDADASSKRAAEIVADYVRALLFLAADGAPPPGKGGRRRIVKSLIREVLAQQRVLGISSLAFLPDLIDAIIALYGSRYPGLSAGREPLLSYLAGENARFSRTLEKGYKTLALIIQAEGRAPKVEQVVDLVKKHGFPLSLIQMELNQRELLYDDQAYHDALAEWRPSRAQAAPT